jgi:uncharacterized lipoprotein YehR (DUF1307 family)
MMGKGLRGVLLAAMGVAMLVGGCDCKEEADKTSSNLTGEKAVETGKELTKELDSIKKQQKEESDKVLKKSP